MPDEASYEISVIEDNIYERYNTTFVPLLYKLA